MLTARQRDDIVCYGQIYHTIQIILSFIRFVRIIDRDVVNFFSLIEVAENYRGCWLVSISRSLCVFLLIFFLVVTQTE